MNLSLRSATIDDADFLYSLHRATMKMYVIQTWGQWDEVWQSLYFHRHFNPATCQIIAFQGQDIGVISVERRPIEMFLSNIELLPPYQGQGIGTYLVRTLVEEAWQKDVPLSLQVLKVNPARKLYERLGFSIIDETATHYRMSTLTQNSA